MTKFALIHFRASETDGVSLEMEKWQKVIRNSGNKCLIIAGSGGELNDSILDFRHPRIATFTKNCFIKLSISEKNLKKEFDNLTKKCEKTFRAFLIKEKPDVLIINNVLSLPINIPFAAALYNLNKTMSNISFWGFHHDFFWERTYNPTNDFTKELVKKYYPPKNLAGHLVINSIAQTELKKRKNLKSEPVDNYFDFSQTQSSLQTPANGLIQYPPEAQKSGDPYLSGLRKKLNLKKNSIVFLHATRIVQRKGIEFALDFVNKFARRKQGYIDKIFYNGKIVNKNTEIVLVFPGLVEDKNYYKMIKAYAKKLGIKTVFCENLCKASKTDDTYSLWDFYKICDAVTYTSILEGWGNQLIEALAFKKPVIVFEYPVFKRDIKKFGFALLSLGGNYRIKKNTRKLQEQRSMRGELRELPQKTINKNVSRLYDILLDKKKYEKITEKNFKIAYKKLSLAALEKRISEIFLKSKNNKPHPLKIK
ncbi:MAG: glycosyltransferase [Elusimicrobia bacterium]|nr:glycosyltransferase [Elusimicrobiota bacterium]